ncbi:hypothetical protein [Microbacterium sp. NPDC057650]|uniref:hypothetical protein n=1 Tax=unclassified Microbacterium TaxID=2609290 RepID=UPI003670E5D8
METTVDLTADRVTASRRATFRPVLILTSAFTVLSAAMIAYLAVASATGIRFEPAIWVRCSLVLASAIVVLLFAVSAARGSRGAWVRLRIVSPIIVAAVIVIVSIPGFLPDWVRLEQAACGLLLLPVAIIANLPRTRALYPARA